MELTLNSIEDLYFLRDAMREAASPDTAYEVGEYQPQAHGPLHLHCGPVSYTVQKMYGGDILTARIRGVTHFWNLIPGDRPVDLCQEQFGISYLLGFHSGKVVPERKTVNPRFKLFFERLMETDNVIVARYKAENT